MSFIRASNDATTSLILIAHHEPLVRMGLFAALARSQFKDSLQICEPSDPKFVDSVCTADVVITDYGQGVDLCARMQHGDLCKLAARPSVLVVTTREGEHEIRSAIDAGVKGYLLAGFELDELTEGIRTLFQGSRYICSTAALKMVDSMSHETLTAREMEVLRSLVNGNVNKRIGDELNIALGTVKAHVKSIFNKFGVSTRTQAATVATERGLLEGISKPTERPPRSFLGKARSLGAERATPGDYHPDASNQ